jgi:hypothetical protein
MRSGLGRRRCMRPECSPSSPDIAIRVIGLLVGDSGKGCIGVGTRLSPGSFSAMRNILSLSIMIILATGTTATARTSHGERSSAMPSLKIEATCRDLLGKVDSKNTTKYSSCVSHELATRGELEQEWAKFSVSDREQCMHMVSPPALESYISLQACLHTARDAKAFMKSGSRPANTQKVP